MNKYFFSLFFLAPLTCWGGAYKCEAPDGSIIFQQFPCADEEKQKRVEIRTSGSAEPEAVEQVDDYSINSQLRRMEEQKRIQSRESNRQKTEAAKQEIERVRREAREADPAFAEARCAEAKAKEREILRKDPTADLAPPLALFRARQLQDLYCKEYKARSLPPSLR